MNHTGSAQTNLLQVSGQGLTVHMCETKQTSCDSYEYERPCASILKSISMRHDFPSFDELLTNVRGQKGHNLLRINEKRAHKTLL